MGLNKCAPTNPETRICRHCQGQFVIMDGRQRKKMVCSDPECQVKERERLREMRRQNSVEWNKRKLPQVEPRGTRKIKNVRRTDKGTLCQICNKPVYKIEQYDDMNDMWITVFDEKYTCSDSCKCQRIRHMRIDTSGIDYTILD